MVHFLVDTPEKITRELCSKFVVDEVMIKLIKFSVLNKNIQKVNVDLGFALKEEIKMLNKKEKAKKPNHLIFIKASKTFFYIMYVITSSQKHPFSLSLPSVVAVLIPILW